MTAIPLFLAACVVALGAASALASALTARRAAAALKMSASTAYLALALVGGAWGSPYGRVVLLALLLCWVGDLMLIAPGRGMAFLAGLGSFLVGHLAYVAAFWTRGVSAPWVLAGLVAAALVGWKVMAWLARHDVPPGMRGPVRMYVVAITLMVAMSVGTWGAGGAWVIPAGAGAFMVSDIFVARERFVTVSSMNVTVGLPLYFLGQALLALSV